MINLLAIRKSTRHSFVHSSACAVAIESVIKVRHLPPTTRHTSVMSSPSSTGPIDVPLSCTPNRSNIIGRSGRTAKLLMTAESVKVFFLSLTSYMIIPSRTSQLLLVDDGRWRKCGGQGKCNTGNAILNLTTGYWPQKFIVLCLVSSCWMALFVVLRIF